MRTRLIQQTLYNALPTETVSPSTATERALYWILQKLGDHDSDLDALNNDGKATLSVRDYGALGDGVHDDRPACQSALNAAAALNGEVLFPAGTYLLSKGGGGYCLQLPAGVSARGVGALTVLKQAPDVAASTRLWELAGANGSLDNMTLDGNKVNQTVDEHRGGVFVRAPNCVVSNVVSQNFTGDGFTTYIGSDGCVFAFCRALNNDRDGYALTGLGGDGYGFIGCYSKGAAAEQFDSEPGGPLTNVYVLGCHFDGTDVPHDAVMTISGVSAAQPSSKWVVTGNILKGPVYQVWCDNVIFTNNVMINHTTLHGYNVHLTCKNTLLANNLLRNTQNSVDGIAVVLVDGNGTEAADDFVMRGNTVMADNKDTYGAWLSGFVRATVEENTFIGSGANGAVSRAGVLVRATLAGVQCRLASVSSNNIRNFGTYGIQVTGNAGPTILYGTFADNILEDTQGTMTTGLRLDDGSGVLVSYSCRNNKGLGGVVTITASLPSGSTTAVAAVGTNNGWQLK